METLSSYKVQSWLLWFLRGVLIFGFLILLARLVDLQLIKGDYYRGLSEGNRIRRVPIIAPRGSIYARGGEQIVGSDEVKFKLTFGSDGYQKSKDLEGSQSSEIITEPLRNYKEGEKIAHITGYLGEVTEDELGKIKAGCPDKGPRKIGEMVGRGGLEEYYDCLLVGINGEELIEVDALGYKVRTLGRKDPIPGSDLHTTIDLGLQLKIAEIMKDKKGAVVVTDPKGEVLALYSSPSFDPNIFVNNKESTAINLILNDKNLPLFNRVISGRFHPGSVYKPVVAIAALEEGKIDRDYMFNDTGQIIINSPYGTFSYKNWYFTQYGGVEGNINLERAIARSTDTFFYKVGELTGVDALVNWSEKFGLDKTTGIDLPGEISGFIPDPEWKMKELGERWFLGNTYHMSIGQGDVSVTPLEINTAISIIANGGKYCNPHLVSLDTLPLENKVRSNYGCSEIGIKKESIDEVKKGMIAACSNGGTAYTFFDFYEKSNNSVGCKTGTAETGDSNDSHAWFTAFSPIDEPQIIATVLIENGGEGSKVAGPIAREIFNTFFKIAVSPSATVQPTEMPAYE